MLLMLALPTVNRSLDDNAISSIHDGSTRRVTDSCAYTPISGALDPNRYKHK